MPIILYIEDDPILQADGELVLTDCGYEVLLASDGATACGLLNQRGAELCALITDINLSGPMQGWEVAEFGRQLCPSLSVLYTSASERSGFDARGVARSVWVPKPFVWGQVLVHVGSLTAG